MKFKNKTNQENDKNSNKKKRGPNMIDKKIKGG
jgi:hypothetical protein